MTITTYDLPSVLGDHPPVRLFESGLSDAGLPRANGWKKLRELILPNLSERLEKEAMLGRPIQLGSFSNPYETLADRRSALAMLANFSGLTVTLSCLDATVAEDLSLLGRIDRDHALTVQWRVDTSDGYRTQAVLAVAAWFSAHGLSTEFHVDSNSEQALASLVKGAAEAGVSDVITAGRRSPGDLDRLRLVYGFPRALPVRG